MKKLILLICLMFVIVFSIGVSAVSNSYYFDFSNTDNISRQYSINISGGLLQRTNINLSPTYKPGIDANTVSYWDFENTLVANFTTGTGTPTSAVEYEYVVINGDTALRTFNSSSGNFGEVSYNKDTMLPNVDNFTYEMGFYFYNTTISDVGDILSSTNAWTLQFNRNGNGVSHWDRQNNFYYNTWKYLDNNSYHIIKVTQIKENNYYKQYVFIDGILGFKGENPSSSKSLFVDWWITPSQNTDIAITWLKFSNTSSIENINATSIEDEDIIFYSALETDTFLTNMSQKNFSLNINLTNNNTSHDNIMVIVHGCTDSLKLNCTKILPKPTLLLVQDGTDGTSSTTFFDNARYYYNFWNLTATLGFRTDTPNTTNTPILQSDGFASGIEGDSDNLHASYLAGVKAQNYTPVNWFRYYQNSVRATGPYNKSFDFIFQGSDEGTQTVTTTPYAPLIGMHQVDQNLAAFTGQVDDTITDNSLNAISFHDTDNLTFLNDSTEYVYNRTLDSNLFVTDVQDITEQLFFTKNINNLYLDYLDEYDYIYLEIMIRGDIKINSLNATFFNETASASPDTTPPNRTITNPTNNTNLSANTLWTYINITTNEIGNCSYNLTDTGYSNMTPFTNTGNISHSFNFSNSSTLNNGNTYTLYYRCQDTSLNNNTISTIHVFGVSTPVTPPVITGRTSSLLRNGVAVMLALAILAAIALPLITKMDITVGLIVTFLLITIIGMIAIQFVFNLT